MVLKQLKNTENFINLLMHLWFLFVSAGENQS